MAEFERFENDATTPQQALNDGRLLPADFTAEEAETASWLNNHFNIAGEELPPLFAKTLLGDPRHAPASDDFEERTINAVFGRLQLERPAAPPPPLVVERAGETRWGWRVAHMAQHVAQRSVVAVLAALMLLSYNAIGTGVALANVLQIVVGHGGVQMVERYPQVTPLKASTNNQVQSLSFTPLWPTATTNGYTFTGMEALPAQWWTQGVMVMLHYTMTDDVGVHHLALMEFLPRTRLALQVVPDGVASTVPVGANSGLFVWGQWTHQSMANQQMVWESSHRAELIFGSNDNTAPVVWIAMDDLGEQSVSQMSDLLVNIADGLRPVTLKDRADMASLRAALDVKVETPYYQPFSDDIIALLPEQGDPATFVNANAQDQTSSGSPHHSAS